MGTEGDVSVGLWAFEPERRAGLLRKAGVSAEVADWWMRRAFAEPARLAG
jgi:hypothetical protein